MWLRQNPYNTRIDRIFKMFNSSTLKSSGGNQGDFTRKFKGNIKGQFMGVFKRDFMLYFIGDFMVDLEEDFL